MGASKPGAVRARSVLERFSIVTSSRRPILLRMNSVCAVRLLSASDLPLAASLSGLAGWNQTRADWERFLATEPEGCFVAEYEGRPAGTATTIVYGQTLGWIGMMLVHPECRRRGVGAALLAHCLEYLRDRGVRCVKLDATPLGQPLYEKFGFRAEWSLQRWEKPSAGTVASRAGTNLRAWRHGDVEAVRGLDAAAFGVNRARLLGTLAAASRVALVFESSPGKVAGFGLLRAGARADYLGPVVAREASVAGALIKALVAAAGGRGVFWDVPDPNREAVRLAGALGFKPQRSLLRMLMGEDGSPGNPCLQFGIGGPEIG